jgi:hypothetical protein
MGTAEWYEDLLSRWQGGLPITEEEWLAHFDHQNQAAVDGIERGTIAPGFSLVDQHGQRRGPRDLLGEDGLLLVFVRGTDW